ncbi:PadR family transcriptional regulator [Bacillus sp. ISL-35]|uniref:PadR family transcriptional regulator n=1 Tax=Bacillus sp. ISL-35 TaxID=2819122 RepID=UPI001BE79A33|nr:PadR family transcriptional regulator [Bacillus sp. ISL-35]MBT2680905.1 PadR family transcriptional regulator [Bacillus sp. ISL-35]MBT2705221.1 PadR family transcriptional regulator [Chryseobacterium sp. ISL-80]
MSIEHSILAVISFRPSTGYDIKSEFEHKAAGLFWGMSYGSLYPKLKKLEEEGFITTIELETGGRKKKLYELTGKGWTELESWLARKPEPPAIKDELFMKMAAWHNEMDLKILAEHLKERAKDSQEILNFVKEWKQNNTSYINSVGMLAMRFAELKLEAELTWIKESLSFLENDELPEGQDPKKLGEKQMERRNTALKKGH